MKKYYLILLVLFLSIFGTMTTNAQNITNGGFESGDFTGWTVDTNFPGYPGDTPVGISQSATVTGADAYATPTEGTKMAKLVISGSVATSCGTAHGPALLSSILTGVQVGDVINFDWKAVLISDDYDVYAFIVDVATGNETQLLHQTGSVSPWTTTSLASPYSGDIRFKFVCGTHDLTCGNAVGANMYIDNIKILRPTATDATSYTATSFTANWLSYTGATTYYLDIATDPAFTNIVPNYNNKNVGNVTSYVVTGLTPGTIYYYRVRGSDGSISSANSNVIKTAPAPVANAATGYGPSSFSANWNTQPLAVGYKIDVATDAAFTNILPSYNDLSTGNVGTYSITGLANNLNYYYRVRADYALSYSSNSNTVNAVFPPVGLAYTPATVIAGKNNTNVSISPTTTGGSPITSYSISPALPAGVTFNTTTGIVSGIPTATSPLTTYTVTASNAGGSTTATFDLKVVDLTITSFLPTSSGNGLTVVITGTNFTGATAVSFGGTPATSFIVDSPTQITAIVGAGASGSVSVTTPSGFASLAGFTWVPAPTITSSSPTSSVAGKLITITGTNFTGATAVSFGGTAATSFTVDSPTQITALVGSGASGSVSVTTAGGTATQAGFTWLSDPTITTTPVYNITNNSVKVDGIPSNANYDVRGFCYSTSANPTISDPNVSVAGGGASIFTGALTGLTPNTPYHVRAYVAKTTYTLVGSTWTPQTDYTYGNDFAFTTKQTAIVTITPSSLTQVYDGTPKQVAYTTLPGTAWIADVTYDGIANVPSKVKAGGYAVTVTIDQTYYYGTATATLDITPKPLTVTGATVADKVYDSNTTASISGGTLTIGAAGNSADGKVVNPDQVILSSTGTGVFSSSNVGARTVSGITGYSISGSDAANYMLTQPTILATATISQRPLSVTAVTDTKIYDATTTSAGSPIVGALQGSDAVNVAPTQVYDNKMVGTTHVMTASGLTIKNGANDVTGNYNISYVTVATGAITQRALTVTAVTDTKIYNATTSSSAASTVGALQGADVVNVAPTQVYDNKMVGTAHVLTTSGLTIKDALNADMTGNYNISYVASPATGVITKRALNVTAVTDTKIYDANTTSSSVPTVGALQGADAVNVAPTQVYDTKMVGTGKTITPSGLTIKDALNADMTGNYNISYVPVSTGVITQRALIVTAVTGTKIYDANTTSSGVPTVGALQGADAVNVAPTQVYDNVNVGSSHVMTASGLTIKDALNANMTGNYDISYLTESTGVITKRPLNVTGVTDSKVYDATTASSAAPIVPLLQGSDAVNAAPIQVYDNPNVASNHLLLPSGLTIKNGANDVTGNYDISYVASPATGVITQMPLTVTGVTDTKTYDGLKTSTGIPTVGTLAVGDQVLVAPIQMFDNKNAGTTHLLVPSGLTIQNSSSVDVTGNYNISYDASPATGTINQKALSVTAVTSTKTYDGLTTSSAAPIVGALISGDVVNVAPTQVFDTKNVGTTHVLTPSGLTIKDIENSADMTGNYNISYVNSPATGVINKTNLTVTANTATKLYDTTTSSSVVPSVGTLVSGDMVNVAPIQVYNNKNVGTGKTLTPSGLTIKDGASVDMTGNYNISYVVTATGTITPVTLSVSGGSATSKIYDNTRTATFTGATLNGVLSGDVVTLNSANLGLFAQTGIGTAIPVVANMTITGTDAGNYTLTQQTGFTANITPRAITVTVDPNQSKTVGNSDPVLKYSYTPALISGDYFTGALTRDPGEVVGNYWIGIGTLNVKNYAITFVNNIFKITPVTGIQLPGAVDNVSVYSFAKQIFIQTDVKSTAVVMDIAGKVIVDKNINEGLSTINVDTKGVYLVRVTTANKQSAVKKVMIQ